MFQTRHLIAERLCPEHLDELCRLYQDPDVMATLSADGRVLHRDSVERILCKGLDHWEDYECGYWVFRDKTSGRFVGRAGLAYCQVGGNDEVELAYAVMPEFWGRGLATEMADACITVAFAQLELANLVCFTLATNVGSRRVMEKAGLHYERDIIHADSPHVLYRITATEWGRIPDESDSIPEAKVM